MLNLCLRHFLFAPMLALCFLISTPALSVGADYSDINSETSFLEKARELIDNYGRNGTLGFTELTAGRIDPKAGLTGYINDAQVKKIFPDADHGVTFEDWYSGYLYCRPLPGNIVNFECNSTDHSEIAKHFEDDFGKIDGIPITNAILYENNSFWRTYVNAKTLTHWSYISDETPEISDDTPERWSLPRVAEYLKKTHGIATARLSPEERLKKLETLASNSSIGSNSTKISEDTFEAFISDEIFDRADTDKSGYLDIYEAKKAFPIEKFLSSFLNASQEEEEPNVQISKKDFDFIPNTPELENYVFAQILVERKQISHTRISAPPKDLEISSIKQDFQSQYENETKRLETEAEKKQNESVSGIGWIPDRGLMILGERKYDKDSKKVSLDGGQPALMMRLIKDYTVDNNKASGATFSLSKTKGEDRESSANAAIRFNYYHPTLYDFSNGHSVVPAFGLQWDRSGSGEKRQDTRRAFLLADWYWGHGDPATSFWSASQILIGPVYERDEVKNIDKVTGMIQVEPLLGFGNFRTGVRLPIFGKDAQTASIYFMPRVALELGEILDSPSDVEEPDANFFRADMKIGIRIFKRAEFTYFPRFYKGLDGSKQTHFSSEFSLEWFFDKEKRYSLTAEYKKGEFAPSFTDIDQYKVGLGVKF